MAEEKFVVFSLGKGEYGVPVCSVKGIIRYDGVTGLPNAPGYMADATDLRESLIPIVELSKRFGLFIDTKTERQVVIVEAAGREFGIVVDGVTEVIRLKQGAIEPVPAVLSNVGYLRGIGKEKDRLLTLLDVEPLFGKTVPKTGQDGHVA